MFAGPNGSGKSTIKDVLPETYLGHYLNPDDIERTLTVSSRFPIQSFGFGHLDAVAVRAFFLNHPLTQKAGLSAAFAGLQVDDDALTFHNVSVNSYVAAILTDWLRQQCIQSGQSLTFETVMSSGDKINVLRAAKQAGFRVYLYYVATDDPAVNLVRVRNRVNAGGHNVPADKITSRYYRSLNLLRDAIRLSDRAYIFDNSGTSRVWIAEVTNGADIVLQTEYVPTWFDRYVLDKTN